MSGWLCPGDGAHLYPSAKTRAARRGNSAVYSVLYTLCVVTLGNASVLSA